MAKLGTTDAGIVVADPEARPFMIGWNGVVTPLLPSDPQVSIEEAVRVLYGVTVTPSADRTRT